MRSATSTLLRHEVVASGPRRWEHKGTLRGWRLSDPEPVTELPIRYELAYGGAYHDPRKAPDARGSNDEAAAEVVHADNPCGVGFHDPDLLDPQRAYPAPQWESPNDPVTSLDRPCGLAGLGPVARHWTARARYIGTTDEAWERRMRADLLERGLPFDYPGDFDPRFFQCAHPALASATHLRGDEQLGLRGLTGAREDLLTRLPAVRVRARILPKGRDWSDATLPLDTVHVDLDLERVYLCWRLSVDQAQGVSDAVLYREGG